jgi:hypothetical protein
LVETPSPSASLLRDSSNKAAPRAKNEFNSRGEASRGLFAELLVLGEELATKVKLDFVAPQYVRARDRDIGDFI